MVDVEIHSQRQLVLPNGISQTSLYLLVATSWYEYSSYSILVLVYNTCTRCRPWQMLKYIHKGSQMALAITDCSMYTSCTSYTSTRYLLVVPTTCLRFRPWQMLKYIHKGSQMELAITRLQYTSWYTRSTTQLYTVLILVI